MNIILQFHTSETVSGKEVYDQVNAALSEWFGPSFNSRPLSVVVTDDIDFAHDAGETNDVVVMLSEKVETVTRNVIVVSKGNIFGELLSGLSRRT
jgi:hypothetical protein